MKIILTVGAACSLVIGAWAIQSANKSDLAGAVKGYQKWTKVTEKPVDMAPSIALSCRGPMPWDMSPNPHVKYVFNVFVNKTGLAAFKKEGKTEFPFGTIIVKEKFDSGRKIEDFSRQPVDLKGKKPVLLTVMRKGKKGSSPDTGDWEFMSATGDLSKTDTTEKKACVNCHVKYAKADLVFRDYALAPGF